jgi:adenylate kinase family enzyme
MPPRRILILGSSGSGKSTLAAQVGQRLSLPYIPTDALFWTADWKPVSGADLRPWLARTAARDAWVTDGNFYSQRDLLWPRADLAIWLDLPRQVSFGRVVRRT